MSVRIVVRALAVCSASIVLVACKAKEPSRAPDSATAAGTVAQRGETSAAAAARADTSGATAAAPATKGCCGGGMSGMHVMTSEAMLDSMQAHMRRAGHMTADQMAAMVPMHRQMVGDMLSQMTSESRAMNLPPNAAWNALADSVRQDLVRLPEMNKNEVKQAMPADCARVTRLIRMHQTMMSGAAK